MAEKSETGAIDADKPKLKYIKFNHKESENDTDAIDMRVNFGNDIKTPEWRCKGNSADLSKKDSDTLKNNVPNSPAAYEIKSIMNGTVTIKVFLESRISKKVKIRAGGGGILGYIDEQEIDLNKEVEIKLEKQELAKHGIIRQKITWNWEYTKDGANWQKIDSTIHTIYVVLDTPTSPWNSMDATSRPWADVLDIACLWAKGKKDTDSAYKAILTNLTKKIDDGSYKYIVGDSGTYVKDNTFNCTQLLNDYSKAAKSKGRINNQIKVNRYDCLAIVTTFSNILGCKINPENKILWKLSDLSVYRSRAQWKARPVNLEAKHRLISDLKVEYDTIAIHHTDGKIDGNITDLQNESLARKDNGEPYLDIPYHFVIGGDGTIYEGRPLKYEGAHTANNNINKIGVVLMGNFHDGEYFDNFNDLINAAKGESHTTPRPKQIENLKKLIRVLDMNYWIDRVGGHRDFTVPGHDSDCPGNIAYPILVSQGIIQLNNLSTTAIPGNISRTVILFKATYSLK